MAGSNRSADLKYPQRSIPVGTVAAQLTTTTTYVIFCLLFGCATSRAHLLTDSFAAATMSVPAPVIVQYGVMAATAGAALQSLISAPRILNAISSDEIIPIMRYLKAAPGKEPRRALGFSALLCGICIAIGDLNFVAPIITMFFLLCYLCVNLACFLLSITKAPGWRPTFKYYHWATALVGIFACISLMIAIDWIMCLVAFTLAALLFQYVSYTSQSLNWGDGVRGVKFQIARTFLTQVEPYAHIKNWRPQVLALIGFSPNPGGSDGVVIADSQLLSFVSQLKHGNGLTIVSGVIEEDAAKIDMSRIRKLNRGLADALKDLDIVGFSKILFTSNRDQGVIDLLQTSGLGGFEPNCVVASWPVDWVVNKRARETFFQTVSLCSRLEKSVALIKTRDDTCMPSRREKMRGTIDIWWIVSDGGLLLLLPVLLTQHKVWHDCKLRLFAVLDGGEDPEVIQRSRDEIGTYVADHRLPIQVNTYVINEGNYDLVASPYLSDLPYRLCKRRFNTQEKVVNHKDLPHPLRSSHILSAGTLQFLFPSLESSVSTIGEKNQLLPPRPKSHQGPSKITKHDDINAKASNQIGDATILHSGRIEKKPLSNSGITRSLVTSTEKPSELTNVTLDPVDTKIRGTGTIERSSSLGLRQAASSRKSSVGTLQDRYRRRSASLNFSTQETSFDLSRDQLLSEEPCSAELLEGAQILNSAFQEMSSEASLIVTNLPDVPSQQSALAYMQFVEILCDGNARTLLLRGSATEVITAFT
eukprot:GHVT01012074.1.p1 GENE.GHVT01012074.1~~GHVT01012074.1.p1  ORF type:complete len:758 (-),score=40.98 GHVT01012074.1:237-2510(-)